MTATGQRGGRRVPLRPELGALEGYHSPQVEVEVRLNTNESPYPPPEAWRAELRRALEAAELHRYPDRSAHELRAALAAFHQVDPEEVFCANGSNEVLQSLLLAYGGPSRTVACFEPTYALHSHIAGITATSVATGRRREDFTVSADEVDAVIEAHHPVVVFLCSPNNPTGTVDPPELTTHTLARAPGLVVVDEAYGQFAPASALELRARPEAQGSLVVVRTFSKIWSMAGVRLGYLVADPEVVAALEAVTLPYHLSTTTQLAGLLALRYRREMEERVAAIVAERRRLAGELAALAVDTWPSEANFLLIRPRAREATEVWEQLVAHSVLVRNCSSWPLLQGCLRVTIGTAQENDRFLEALAGALR